MKLSMIVTPFSDANLRKAAQVGVEEIVMVYPGPGIGPLREARRRVEASGMRLTHVERKVPHSAIVHGLPGRDEQVAEVKALIRNMGETGMEVLCYNWMPSEDWVRTTAENPARGGSKSTAFDLSEAGSGGGVTDADGRPGGITPADRLWENLGRFLEEVIPVAEDAGVKLAIHPDDPPLPMFLGQPQIITDWKSMMKVVELVPSGSNGACYCTGTLGLHGMVGLLEGIRALAGKIHFVHLRNVQGTPECFEETWHDDGELDLPAVVRALKEIGYQGTVRPDHAPSMEGEENKTPGYEMGGRLFAAGYLRGLFQAV